MQSVVVVAPSGFGIGGFLEHLSDPWSVERQSPYRLVVQSGKRYVAITMESDIRTDYEADELAKVLAIVTNPEFYLVEFNDFSFGKEVLKVLADDARVAVDNDHGMILPGPEFVRLMRQQPHWDWRDDVQKKSLGGKGARYA